MRYRIPRTRRAGAGVTGACLVATAALIGPALSWAAERTSEAISSSTVTGTEATTRHGMVVGTTRPGAVEAGLRILQEGGSAVDAAMATALVQICYSGGSEVSYQGVISMLIYDASSRRVVDMNGVWNTVQGEDDPLSIPGIDRASMKRDERADRIRTAPSGRTALVGGFMKGVEAAHERYGRLPFPKLFEPAIRCAEEGWTWTEDFAALYAGHREALRRLPESRRVFTKPDGSEYRVGDTFRQPELARTLRAVARDGAAYMYTGPWARKFVAQVRAEGGKMTMKDLADYRIAWNNPISTTYAGHEIHAAGHGLMGGYAILSSLNLLEAAGFGRMPFYGGSPEALYVLAQSIKPGLYGVRFGPKALESIGAKLEIDLSTSSLVRKDTAARLWDSLRTGAFERAMTPSEGTVSSHSDSIVAVDKDGNVVSVVHSINTIPWGNTGIFVDGVSVADAAFYQRQLIAQTPRGGRLPVSASPAIVLRNGHAVLGLSAIGTGLVPRTVAAIASVVDRGFSPRQALDAPSIGDFTFDSGKFDALSVPPHELTPEVVAGVERLGQPVNEALEWPGVCVLIQRDPTSGELIGAVEKNQALPSLVAGY